MKIRMLSRWAACAVFATGMLGCGLAVAGTLEALKAHVPDQVEFDAAKNAAVRKIAILHINPTKHLVVENASLLAAALPGFVELSIESSVNGKHAGDYLAQMKLKSVDFVPVLVDSLQQQLHAQGYDVAYLQQSPRLKDDKKTLDYTNIRTDADALLVVWYGKTGYWSPLTKPDLAPLIIMGVKLVDAHTFETIFFKTFDVTPVASQVSNSNVEAILPDQKYLFPNFDDLMARFDESVQGILDSESLIAAHVAQHLKPAAPIAAQPVAAAASNP